MIIATFGTNGNTTPAFCGKAKGIARFSYRIEGADHHRICYLHTSQKPGCKAAAGMWISD